MKTFLHLLSKLVIIIVVTFSFIKNINSADNNSTDCANLANPLTVSDCNAIDASNVFGRPHTCCLFAMSYPKKMNRCIPVENEFLPLNDFTTSMNLPGDVQINGVVSCKGFNTLLNYVVFAYLFLVLN